jgi:hypothetical protein
MSFDVILSYKNSFIGLKKIIWLNILAWALGSFIGIAPGYAL